MVNKLHPIALGITFGIIAGLSVFSMGLVAHFFMSGKPLVAAMGSMYVTYNPSPVNSALGGVLAFVNAFIAGYIAGWIYNLLLEYIFEKETRLTLQE